MIASERVRFVNIWIVLRDTFCFSLDAIIANGVRSYREDAAHFSPLTCPAALRALADLSAFGRRLLWNEFFVRRHGGLLGNLGWIICMEGGKDESKVCVIVVMMR